MTQNQIKFAELAEAKRHNVAVEQKDVKALEESARHNVAQEGINWYEAGAKQTAATASLMQAQSKSAQVEKELRQEMLQDVGMATGAVSNVVAPLVKLFV